MYAIMIDCTYTFAKNFNLRFLVVFRMKTAMI